MYYPINETTARCSHEMRSFRDYRPGSATEEYHRQVDAAAALVEKQKTKVSPFYHDKLDHLFDAYARTLAEAINNENRIGCMCPSVMISGGSNFPTRKKEKQVKAWDANRANFQHAEDLLQKIRSTGTGAVDLADPHAREILSDRLAALQSDLDACKAANAYYRKHKTLDGCPGISAKEREWLTRPGVFAKDDGSPLALYGCPFPSYHLTGIRDKIKRTAARLAELDARQSQPETGETAIAEGVTVVRNTQLDRLQILFADIPDEETRTALKAHGFRWSPKNKAWQRQLTRNAEIALKNIFPA